MADATSPAHMAPPYRALLVLCHPPPPPPSPLPPPSPPALASPPAPASLPTPDLSTPYFFLSPDSDDLRFTIDDDANDDDAAAAAAAPFPLSLFDPSYIPAEAAPTTTPPMLMGPRVAGPSANYYSKPPEEFCCPTGASSHYAGTCCDRTPECGRECADACEMCCDPQACTTMICEDENCGAASCEVVVECDEECDDDCGGSTCVNACPSPQCGSEYRDGWPDLRRQSGMQYGQGNNQVSSSSNGGVLMQSCVSGYGYAGNGFTDMPTSGLTVPPRYERTHSTGGGFSESSYFAALMEKRPSGSSSASSSMYHHDLPSPSKRRRLSSMTISTPIDSTDGYTTAPSSVSPTPRSTSVNGEPLFSCQWDLSCDATFLNGGALWDHIQTTHNPLDRVCHWNDCGLTYADSHALFDHLAHTHVPPLVNNKSCPQHCCLWQGCNESFANEDDLRRHINDAHLQKDMHQCLWQACGIEAPTDEDILEHVQKEHVHHDHVHIHGFQKKQENQPKLPPSARKQDNLAQIAPPTPITRDPTPLSPARLPSDEKPVSSSPAAAASADTTSSSSSYSSSGPKICKWQDKLDGELHTCNLEFATADELQQHAKSAHISALKKRTGYFCRWEGCGRKSGASFSQKGKVERHLQTHTGYKSCTCEHCGKEFSAPQALQQHIRTHTGEKPYKCDVCGKEFAQGSAMTMHKRVHTGERPLMCDFPGCGKRFSESSNLSKHRKTHNAVGQHRCSFPGCTRSFHRLDQMKRHLKTHEGAVPPSTTTAAAAAAAESSGKVGE